MARSLSRDDRAGHAPLAKTALRYSARGDYRAAEKTLRAALRLTANAIPGRDRLVLWNELGMVSKYLGKFDTAERYYRLALRHADGCFSSPEREFFLANLYHNLGGLEHSRRHFLRGEKYTRKALELRLQVAPPDSLAVASDRAALAAILDGLHRFVEAERHYQHALITYRREYGASHPETAVILNNLGALYQATGRQKCAELHYRAALRIKRKELGASHPDVAVTMNNLALFYSSQNRTNAARAWLNKALHILNESLGNLHPTARAVRKNYQRLCR